jgi:hypothetical protein
MTLKMVLYESLVHNDPDQEGSVYMFSIVGSKTLEGSSWDVLTFERLIRNCLRAFEEEAVAL